MTNIKKILFIITQSEMGGAQKFLGYLIPYLKNRGFDVVLASGENKNPLLVSVKLKHLQRSPNPLQGFLAIGEIYKLLKTEQPDVLFLCSSMAGFLGSIAGKIYKMRGASLQIVYRIGGWAFNDPRPLWQKLLIIAVEKATSRLKDKIIVNSEVDLQTALKHKIANARGGTSGKLVKIYNGIDADKINFLDRQAARQALGLPNNITIIGTIANFYKTKGLNILINAMPEVTPRALAVIVGEGRERKNLAALIKQHNLQNRVLLLGRKENASQYLKTFDVFVLPSLKEGFPWAILEAMAAGVPIIATQVGAVPEILENKKSGLLVEPGNAEQLTSAIKELLNSPTLQTLLSQNSTARLADFPLAKMLSETEKIIVGS